MRRMWSGVAALVVASIVPLAARAEEAGSLSPGEQCAAAINAAQQREKIPGGRLAAIGQVESGRRDPATRRWSPWPWTIDVGGKGTFFDSAAAAIAAVQALQAQGVRSIDVGCVQVNLLHHPNAFASLAEAFDPVANAAYGARFLVQLHAATGDWDRAVGYYHSATPALAADYEERVLGIHPDAPLIAASAAPRPPTPVQQLASAWSATLDAGATGTPSFARSAQAVARVGAEPVEVAEAPRARLSRMQRAGVKARHAGSP